MTGHALTVEQKRLVAELWAVRPMISVRLIAAQVTPRMSKSGVIGLVRRLGLPARPSPIRRGVTPKPVPPPPPPRPKPKPAREARPASVVRKAKPVPKPVVARVPSPKPVVRRRALPKIAAVTAVPVPLPRGSGPLLWSFGCPACARRLFGPDQCAARLEAMAA